MFYPVFLRAKNLMYTILQAVLLHIIFPYFLVSEDLLLWFPCILRGLLRPKLQVSIILATHDIHHIE